MARTSRKFRAINYEWHDWFNEEFKDKQALEQAMGTTVHYPNKNEARALRRICAKTGLKPDQVRAIKKYRQELAQAAGPQFRKKHDDENKNNPWRGMTAEEIDKQKFATKMFVTVTHKAFPGLWAKELERREVQAMIDKLSEDNMVEL